MSTENSRREQPSTYFVQDRSNREERERVRLQDEMLTSMMGGVLPEQPDPSLFHEVLDIGCGSGGWLIEAAKAYSGMTRLVGIDVSSKMVDYARAHADAEGVADRVEFHVMDVLLQLDFPDDSFDLVNQRLGSSYVRTWEWPDLLQTYQRIVRSHGVIRITECAPPQANTPAFTQINELLVTTLFNAGHLRTQQGDAALHLLPTLFKQQGFQHVQTHPHVLKYVAGTREGKLFTEDTKYILRTLIPFFRKWTRLPDNYDELCQQAINETRQPGFVGTWNLLTIWGNPPISKVRTRSQ